MATGVAERPAGKVTVVGAGFSGLVMTHFLVRDGWEVEVLEEHQQEGGMIRTLDLPFGQIETAANGILSSWRLESLCQELGIEIISPTPESRRREIFREGKGSRWPLTVKETGRFLMNLPRVRRSAPEAGETVSAWAGRVLGDAARDYLVAPALQGIYAGDPAQMSASLILGRFFEKKSGSQGAGRRRKKGTVTFKGGMSGLMTSLRSALSERGVKFRFGSPVEDLGALRTPVVLAVPLHRAAKLLDPLSPSAAADLRRIPMLPIVSVSLAYPRISGERHGFGCLFPRSEGVRSLGVLFEQDIFGNRSEHHLERWILGGAQDPGALKLSDGEILEVIRQDRARYYTGATEVKEERREPLDYHVSRWEQGLPHYTLELEKVLKSEALRLLPNEGVYLVGNYLGKLGLSGILEVAAGVAQQMKREA